MRCDDGTVRSHQADSARFFPIQLFRTRRSCRSITRPSHSPSPHTQTPELTRSRPLSPAAAPASPQSPRGDRMAEPERERAAEEWVRRKRGRKRQGERQTSDPMEVLGEDVMGRVMEFLDARSVARCTAVSCAWRGVAADNRLWAPKVRFGSGLLPLSSRTPHISRLLACAFARATQVGCFFVVLLLLFDELLRNEGDTKPSIPSTTLVLRFAGLGMRLTVLLVWGENPQIS